MKMITIEDSVPIQTTGHSSKGNQLKWQTGGIWYKADCLGYESLAEVVASSFLEMSNISDFVRYEPARIQWQGRLYDGCMSKSFRSGEWQLITVEKLYYLYTGLSIAQEMARYSEAEDRIRAMAGFVEKVTGLSGFGKYLAIMLEIDAFFLNEDRHTNNIALLTNPKTGEYDYCPYFDYGASLFSDLLGDYPLTKNLEQCRETISAKPFSEDFDEQADAACRIYKGGFKFTAGKRDLLKRLEEILADYRNQSVRSDAEQIAKRVEDLMREQLRKYQLYLGR